LAVSFAKKKHRTELGRDYWWDPPYLTCDADLVILEGGGGGGSDSLEQNPDPVKINFVLQNK
jgi:hypothetical protein